MTTRFYRWEVKCGSKTVMLSLEVRDLGLIPYKIGDGDKLLQYVDVSRDHAAQLLRNARHQGFAVQVKTYRAPKGWDVITA